MADYLNQLDLRLTRRHAGGFISDRETVDFNTARRDVAIVQGLANLTQALLNRLHTRKGELANLGHPDYGSRLYQLIGELNNPRTRALAEMYIRECLAQETRIAEVIGVEFASPARDAERDTLKVTVIVRPIAEETPLPLSFSLNLGS